MDKSFPEIKTFFGFGCMRLPMIGKEVDIEQFKEMTDYFIENGFNYFVSLIDGLIYEVERG